MDLQAAAERWSLTLGEPYEQGAAGYTTRAELDDGTPVVLKLVHPHRESECEADALEAWDGDGAVRLLARDERGYVLVLERCVHVLVRMRLPRGVVGEVSMLVVLIVHVGVGMLHRLVKMLVLVMLRQMQPHADGHQ